MNPNPPSTQSKQGHAPMTLERALELRRLIAAGTRPATWTAEEGAEALKALKRLEAAAPDLLHALIMALPYIEMAESDDAYKPGEVAKITRLVRAAILRAEQGGGE